MKVLLINSLKKDGGTEVQHWREYNLLKERGHEVFSITFDPNEPESAGPQFNVPINESIVEKLASRVFEIGPKRKVQEIVDSINPDVVHLNNIISIPILVYRIIRQYPCVQTIRDYSAVCPKGTYVHSNYTVCKGFSSSKCLRCGLNNNEFVKLCIRNHLLKEREKTVNAFVAPSEALARTCSKNGIPTICINNPFDFSLVRNDARSILYSEKHDYYLYYGAISMNKGIFRLIEAFSLFHQQNPDTQLIVAGKVNNNDKSRFTELLNSNNWIVYKGIVDNKEMIDLVRSVHCVVVPSLWIENYPNTVLEALAAKVLVIGSDRGGIPEMILDNKLLFNVLDIESINDRLNYTYSLPESSYKRVVEESFLRVLANNHKDVYYSKLITIFHRAIMLNKCQQIS